VSLSTSYDASNHHLIFTHWDSWPRMKQDFLFLWYLYMSQSSTYFSCYLLSAAFELSTNSDPNHARMKNHSYKPTLKCWTKWSYYI